MICEHCVRSFSTRSNLLRHMRTSCPYLSTVEDIPKKKIKLCICGEHGECVENGIKTTPQIGRKRLNQPVAEYIGRGIEKMQSAFKNRISTYRISSDEDSINPSDFLSSIQSKVSHILQKYIQKHTTFKVNFELFGVYVIPEKGLTEIKSFNTANKILNNSTEINQVYEDFKDEISSQATEFQTRDSGWSLQRVMFLDVNINKFSPLSASGFIKLPKQLVRKQAILNIHNSDNACFAWSINAAIFPANGDPTQTSSYPHYTTILNFDGIEFPVKLTDIKRFEFLNNISLNVFGVDTLYKNGKTVTEIIGPLYFTPQRQPTHVNLLLLTNDSGETHYSLITDLSRLVSRQKSKHNGRVYICDGCLQFFSDSKKLQDHEKNDCIHRVTEIPTTNLIINKCGEEIPGNILKFVNFEKQLTVPFVIYADFESILKPIHHNQPSDEKSFTINTFEHEPYSFAFYVKCNFNDEYSKLYKYRGPNAAEEFSRKLDEVVLEVYNNHLKNIKPMKPLSTEEENYFQASTECNICEKPFHSNDVKVRDHCHLTGEYRNAAHKSCNLNYKIPKFIPVFLHNLTNYDSHLFIKKLALNKEKVHVIGQTKEKYVSFSKNILVEKSIDPKIPSTFMRLRFVDSFRFLSRGLDKLSQTLESSLCHEVRKYFPDDNKFNLIRRKGVFPYSYVESFERLEDQDLPPKEMFYNTLKGESLSDEDYQRALKVWETFKCSNLGEYSDIYLISDVLLLADIFENFRKVCLKHYNLDPAHYLTAPGLSWDAMLRCTKIELELLTDIDMVHMVKKGIRGGVCVCTKRRAIANNKFIPNFDPTKPSSYIMYLDANNLYGYAMSQFLPNSKFRWLSQEEIEEFNCNSISDNSDKGYILEVDIEYPHSKHDEHNDLPFCAENLIAPGSKHPKLIPNLLNKEKYIIHYRNLKQCLENGLKLTKTYRILEFAQSPWLKPYIDLNTNLRNSARNEFERDLYKLMNNSVFGKTMENADKRVNIKLCSHWENGRNSPGAEGLIAKPYFKSCSIFGENLVAIELGQIKVVYDKPLYIGFSILDISKTVIYDFFYNFIKKKYGDKATLCYTDTDSLILEVFTENFYDDMKQNLEHFDTSNYSSENAHGMQKTIPILGRMKDEYKGDVIHSFYGTGAKAYSVKLGSELTKKAKGISKDVIQKLQLSDYVQIVENGGQIYRKMFIFVSKMHTIYTQLKNKVALSSDDDKRYILEDNVRSLAWGHKKLVDINLDNFLRIANNIINCENF